MITYIYWMGIVAAMALVFGICVKTEHFKTGIIASLVILAIGWGTYYFRLQQIFVKHYGGVMTIEVPKGQHHISATWKDDNLWVENFDPETNSCIFSEYSKGNLLQGKVTIKNCNPLMPPR